MSRRFADTVYRGLKTATRRVVESCGPLKVACAESRILSDSTLARFYNQGPDGECRFIPVDVALDLMAASGDTSLLERMAFYLGLDVVAKASPAPDAAKAAARQITGLAELIADLSQVAADGKITPAEIEDKDLIRDLTAVIKNAKKLKTSLEATLWESAE